jgi:hypothetical protein
MTFSKSLTLALAWSALIFATPGCLSNSDSLVNAREENVPAPSTSPSPSSTAIYAEGWNTVVIVANYAKTKVDRIGHWMTSRNACGKEADGALDLAFWNQLAHAINKGIALEPMSAPRCTPLPANTKMDGTADVFMDHGVRTLVEVKDSEICTTIKDEKTANDLIEAISHIVEIADKEDCPGGWGSG